MGARHAWRLNLALPRHLGDGGRCVQAAVAQAPVELVPSPTVSALGAARFALIAGGARIEFGKDASAETFRQVLRGPTSVLTLPPTVRVFGAVEPFDMRGSFGSTACAVRPIGLEFDNPLHVA